jgi:pimeloyl-CoA synthetase
MAEIIQFSGASEQRWNMVKEAIKKNLQQHGVPDDVINQALTELKKVYLEQINKTISVKFDIVDVEGLTEVQKKKLTEAFTQSTNILEEQINQYSATLLALIAGLYVRAIMAERGLKSSLKIDA